MIPRRALATLWLLVVLALIGGTATSRAATSEEIAEPTRSSGDCVQGMVGSGVGGTESTDNGGVTATGCVTMAAY